jgi:hypothetical protein
MADSVHSNWQRGSAADLWRHTLSQIHCIFGRLVYLSSLRNANTGRYEHHGLALVFGADEADSTLRRSHQEAFDEWLGFNIEQQKADLDLYFSEQGADRRTIVDTWLRLASYRNLVPASAEPMQRQLYLADLETILGLLKNEYGVAAPGPTA